MKKRTAIFLFCFLYFGNLFAQISLRLSGGPLFILTGNTDPNKKDPSVLNSYKWPCENQAGTRFLLETSFAKTLLPNKKFLVRQLHVSARTGYSYTYAETPYQKTTVNGVYMYQYYDSRFFLIRNSIIIGFSAGYTFGTRLKASFEIGGDLETCFMDRSYISYHRKKYKQTYINGGGSFPSSIQLVYQSTTTGKEKVFAHIFVPQVFAVCRGTFYSKKIFEAGASASLTLLSRSISTEYVIKYRTLSCGLWIQFNLPEE